MPSGRLRETKGHGPDGPIQGSDELVASVNVDVLHEASALGRGEGGCQAIPCNDLVDDGVLGRRRKVLLHDEVIDAVGEGRQGPALDGALSGSPGRECLEEGGPW